MPSLSESDYYAELQLGSNATAEEITASYRRLARIHHPDKNPDNLEAATVAFQKVPPLRSSLLTSATVS